MVCFLVYMYNVQVYQAYQVLQYHLSVSATLTYRLPLNLLSVHGIRTQNIIYTHTHLTFLEIWNTNLLCESSNVPSRKPI